ncbi:hypothetical protein O0I10_008953 [Lichtheimia ornata]|uniref:Malic enzyme n=1 Tax=Lichtheimia ornata TaxID=688661 RepID=A0AAD7XSM7_9FUNG|nr:uncharacterized protein O0I10_008953 [Lichtheimia ornata]KAJ8655459.1 hypothetical protein O0I10_008953 [Lichtheimia ornata]
MSFSFHSLKVDTYGDQPGNPERVKTCLAGQAILDKPLLNKGTAFTKKEREKLRLCGMLPYKINTLDEQTARLKEQYDKLQRPIIKNAFMQNIHDQNETLFYNFVIQNLESILPIIYTPTESEYIASYSHVFHRPRGVYLNYPEDDNLEHVLLEGALQNGIAPENVDVIVVTDSGAILGIGDQGVGGVAISVAKLVLYTAMAGINPARVLPVVLDVGTNNQKLLDDPLYLGWRHQRVEGNDYDCFVDKFTQCVRAHFPRAFLHWEDFGVHNARKLLVRYQPVMATFNDDIQGTGAITIASIMSALKISGGKMRDQRFVIFGSGTAGMGIADQVRSYLETKDGMETQHAAKQIWCLDKEGLLTKDMDDLAEQQKRYARDPEEWGDGSKGLLDVVKRVHPTVLIGCSTQPGAFTQEIVETMAQHCDHPIIFPLSNPTRLHEAKPNDLFKWTKGKVFVATGSPFDPVEYNGDKYAVAECNNSFVFPGIGLGCVVSQAKHCTDPMIFAAANAISECSPSTQSKDRKHSLLPDVKDAREVSVQVAIAVAKKAIELGEAKALPKDIEATVRDFMWEPRYADYELVCE